MKTLYLKTTMKLLRLLPVLIFFMLAMSYHARSQGVVKTPLCYGEPIQLLCNYSAGCDNQFATFHWENFSGSWTSSERDPVINVGEVGYATDKFYLSIQFAPPPGGFFGGRVTVTVLAPIIITGITTPVICFGANTGAIDISVSGGQIPYTYLWSNGATTQDLTNLAAGSYTVTVTDGRSCTQASSAFVVTQPLVPFIIPGTPSDPTCNGAATGSITTTPIGGVAPIAYIWSNGQTSQDISGLTAGTYAVTATDFNGCKAFNSWTLGQPSAIQVTSEMLPVACFGGNDGTITVSATGGTPPYTYLWSNGQITNVASGLAAGCYTVTVSDANLCPAIHSNCVTQPDALAATAVVTDVLCNGDCNGMINVSVTGGTPGLGYTYLWSNGSTSEDVSQLCAGTYFVTITDANNCILVKDWTVGAPAVLTVSAVPADASCFEACDGSINLTVNGGTAPFTYSWSNLATTEDISGLCRGSYSVVVTDAHNCTAFGFATVGAPSALAVTGIAGSASCYNVCDGTIDITPSGGTAPYGYVWSNPAGSTTQDVTGLCAGDYFVTITDAHNCTLVDSWTVTQPGEVSWQGSTTNVTCNGACNGTITTEFTLGGTPPYTYLWNNGATTKDLTNLCAGLYELTVTDSHSCDARAFRTITEPAILAVDPIAVITPALCYNGTGGTIDITVTGGTEPYGYLWSNNATTQDINGLSFGCYTVTVTDAQACITTATFCVGQPEPVAAIGFVTDALCKGDCNGMIALTSVSGGTAPYTFEWSNLATTQDISGLCEGTYTVTVMDANECIFVGSWTVGAPVALSVTGIPSSASCFGSCDGSIDITPDGGTAPYTYVWSNPAASTSQDVTALCPGDYTVTITDAHNCMLVDSWTVTEPGEVSWQGSTTNVTCNGACNGTITTEFTLGGTPPYTYLWNNGATTKDLTGLCAGLYELTVTDSHSCDARAFRTITEPDVLVINPVGVITPATCFNGTGGSIEITVTGGTTPYSFLWSNNATTQNIGGLSAGCYTVTVTDANNCMDTETFCVGQPDPIAAIGVVTDVLCKGDCNGLITLTSVTGGTAPYDFSWSNGATTQDVSGLCEGTYTVTILDAHECVFVGSWTVGSPDALAVTGVGSSTLCFGDCNGSIAIVPTGGTTPYTYIWSDLAGTTTQNVTGLCAGDYSVTITDAHNCSLVGSWTVDQPGEVSWQGSTTNVTCNGACNGTITTEFTMGGTPPYTYLWNNGATTKDLTGLCAGFYELTVTDSHSCDARSFRTIYEPAVLTVDPLAVITPALCYNGTGGAIDITVTGGTEPYSYLWSNNEITQDIFGLSAGCYTVTVTDYQLCMTTASFCVGQPDPVTVTDDVTNVSCKTYCDGAIDITVAGGTAPYTYLWSNFATTDDISGLCEGVYTVVVTDAHQCTGTASFTVGSPDALAVTGAGTPANCYGECNGSINIVPSGGTTPYTYVWSDPAGSTTQNVTGLCAGDYFVTITDAHNCTLVDSWTVTQPGEVSWQGSTTNVTCNGACNGTITTEFTLGGTPPYTYLWSNGATTADLTGLCAGLYSLTVTDSHSCDARSFRTITQPDVLVINPVGVITPALCYGGSGGSIEITVTGGTLPYSFLWSNNATTQNISGLAAGCYTVTVTDANACMDTETFCVGQPDAIAAIGVVTDALCKGDCNGIITLTSVTGGTAPYAFAWSNGTTTQDNSGLCEGTYTVTITDAHTCDYVASWTVGAPDVLAVTGIPTNSLCYGDCNGTIDITPVGGTTPYTYVWSDPAATTTQDVAGLCAGDYFVTITDAHNCTVIDSWTIGQPGEVSWQGSTTNVTCNGACNGTITTEFTMGGTPPYTYLWNNGATTKDLTGLCAGLYELTVTDSHSCDARSFRTITEPDVLAIGSSPDITNVSCNGFENGAIDITVTGGTEPYTYIWSNGVTTQDLTGLVAGCYTVTVTDIQNCMTTASFCVTQPDILAMVGETTDVSCYGVCDGTIELTVTGGTMPYQFAWSNFATTQEITGLCAGTYYVTVTDAHSCDIVGSWTITQPDELIIGQPVVTMVTCNGASNGSINGGMIPGAPPIILPIPVTGGTPPYTYIWSNGLTTDNLCCLIAGCYTVTVTDAHGCTDIASWCITEPPALSLEGAITSVSCYAGATGAINLTVTGGTPPYQSYTWSNGATTEDITGLTAGIYSVTVEDLNGCLVTGSWEILQPTQLVVTLVDITDVSCFGLADGGIEITVTGGTTPYSFVWSNSATTQNITGLTAGCYTVTVTDGNGCTTTGSWCVTQPDALALEASITSVDCYSFSTGAIDLTVTGGTQAYTYVWSNGATTEDISGLLAGLYTVTVTDAHSCEISGTYEVLEPPMWSVGLTGPTSACCNAPGVDDYYANVGGFLGYLPGTTIPCTADDITYEWVVVGGTITSGWNTDHITVDWECCTVGTVTVTATKCDGCYLSTTLTVAVSLPPAPVVTGPATVYSNGTDTYCALPYIPGHLYSWTVINGSYTTIPGTNCITVTWNSYPACGCAMVIVCETDPITGCTGCDTLYITMLPNPADISIQGTVSYKNGLPNTPLNGVTIKLRDLTSGLIIGTTVSGPNMNPPLYTGDPGYYAFTNVPAGNYRLESSFNGTWGGNNATDALLVQIQAGLEFGSPSSWILQGLYHTVGDVNASGFVTALDALYIKLRTVGSINSYPAGDWKFEEPVVTTTPAVVDFAGLCVGDVNGSYIPTGFKEVSFLSVVDDETQIVPVEQTFAYEIRSNMVAQLGAMTLFMGYDKDQFEVMDVTASSNDEMKYVIEDGNVSIAWADTKPMSVRNNDQIFTLNVKAKAPISDATQIFNVKAGSEFASPTGTRYDNFDLKMSKVITSGGSNEFSIFNYPNPFANHTKIVYTLPEAGKVTLVITDMFGKTIRTLVNDFQAAGTYTIPVNAVELNMTSGVYLYRIEAAGATDTFVKVNKMIFAR